jgi:hypothetical protein
MNIYVFLEGIAGKNRMILCDESQIVEQPSCH